MENIRGIMNGTHSYQPGENDKFTNNPREEATDFQGRPAETPTEGVAATANAVAVDVDVDIDVEVDVEIIEKDITVKA